MVDPGSPVTTGTLQMHHEVIAFFNDAQNGLRLGLRPSYRCDRPLRGNGSRAAGGGEQNKQSIGVR